MTHPTLKVAFFGMFMSLDFAIGFIPFGGLIIGWLIFPSVYVLCGKKFAFFFWAYGWVSTLPNFIGSTSSTVPVAMQVANHQAKPIFIPYLTPALESLGMDLIPLLKYLAPVNNVLLTFDMYLRMGIADLPIPLRFLFAMGIFSGLLLFLARSYIRSAEHTLSAIPQLISYGIISPDMKARVCQVPSCQYRTFSDWAFKRHQKRGKHKR